MTKAKEKSSYFVRLRAPNDLRRHILEGSKDVIQTLQRYQSLLAHREKKLLLLNELRRQLQEISLLQTELKNVMPDYDIPIPKKKVVKKHSKKKKKSSGKEAPHKQSELEQLNSALSSIEEKLRKVR